MKKIVLSLAGAAALLATPALGADLRMATKAPVVAYVSPWDIAFGASLANDYNFRGISQSNRGPSVSAYFEPRFNVNPNLQLYAGIAGASVSLATTPSAEIDFYAGIRPTFGPLALDLGFIYYYYPNETQVCGTGVGVCLGRPAYPNGNTTLANTDFWEVYGKAAWTVNDIVTLGANVYYSPSWLNTGAAGTYGSITAKLTAPSTMFPTVGAYLSGELGNYWLGTTSLLPGIYTNTAGTAGFDLPDYVYWNIGVGFTYKVLTLDLRYHDTNLSGAGCSALTADPGAAILTPAVAVTNAFWGSSSRWCSSAFIAKLSFDTTLAAFK